MTILLGIIALETHFTPANAHAQKQYRYEVVRVQEQDVQGILAKRVAEGWEPVSLSFYSTSNSSGGLGYLLIRK
jgi:hypothetical protein